MTTQQLSEQLISDVKQIITQTELHFLPLEIEKLNWKESAEQWEYPGMFEHLNRYSRYYNPIIGRAVMSQPSGAMNTNRDGWVGSLST